MECKRATDTRKLDPKARAHLRQRAIHLLQAGESPEVVAESLGINRSTIYRWIGRFEAGGQAGLADQPKSGRPSKLSASDVAWLAQTLREYDPRQFRFAFALWTLSMVQILIGDHLGHRLSVSSVRRLLRGLGFSPQRPLWRAYQQDPELVEQWRTQDYPRLKRRAKRAGAVVWFADEAGVRTDHHAGRSWAPRGQTPVVNTSGQRAGVNMISAVSPRGDFRFMLVDGRVTAATFCQFLDRLMTTTDHNVFLVVDRHGAHTAAKVRRKVESFEGRLELHFLPPYSPELNPDELVWGYVKNRVGRMAQHGKDELKRQLASVLHSLQRRISTLQSFFRHLDCRYVIE